MGDTDRFPIDGSRLATYPKDHFYTVASLKYCPLVSTPKH